MYLQSFENGKASYVSVQAGTLLSEVCPKQCGVAESNGEDPTITEPDSENYVKSTSAAGSHKSLVALMAAAIISWSLVW